MIYVDRYPDWIVHHKPKWLGGGHLFGTDLNELHNFARLIGLKREWYQGAQFPHYDLTKNKRALAIQMGAFRLAPGVIPKGVIRHDPTYRHLRRR
jgi:hypothetical protein